MPAILAFLAALAPVAVPLATRIMVGLGFAAITFAGVGALWSQVEAAIWSNLGSVSTNVLALLVIARVDDGIAVILSAGAAKLALRGLTAAGALKSVVFRGSGA